MTTNPNPGCLSILFVDDEDSILGGLRRQLHASRRIWNMRFAGSGEEALRLMAESPAEVVISDMRMPVMNGAELLERVRERWPGTVRIMLSGQTDQSELLDFIGAVHQFLQKPCSIEQLRGAVERTGKLARLIESPELRGIAAGLISLPVLPQSYRKLLEALDDDHVNAGAVALLIDADVGLRTKLLQMVNSAFFGLPRQIDDTREAVVLLGLRSIWSLAVTSHAFDAMADSHMAREPVSRLWSHSADLGAAAAALALRAGRNQHEIAQARLAGTLALIGRAVLVRHAHTRFRRAQNRAEAEQLLLHEAETLECGASQEAVGAYALGLWAFDDRVIEAVLYQCHPAKSGVTDPTHPLSYVHLARTMTESSALVEKIPCSAEFVARVGLNELLTPRRSAA